MEETDTRFLSGKSGMTMACLTKEEGKEPADTGLRPDRLQERGCCVTAEKASSLPYIQSLA